MNPQIAVELKAQLKCLNHALRDLLDKAESDCDNFPPGFLERFQETQSSLQFIVGRLGNHIQFQRAQFLEYAQLMHQKRS